MRFVRSTIVIRFQRRRSRPSGAGRVAGVGGRLAHLRARNRVCRAPAPRSRQARRVLHDEARVRAPARSDLRSRFADGGRDRGAASVQGRSPTESLAITAAGASWASDVAGRCPRGPGPSPDRPRLAFVRQRGAALRPRLPTRGHRRDRHAGAGRSCRSWFGRSRRVDLWGRRDSFDGSHPGIDLSSARRASTPFDRCASALVIAAPMIAAQIARLAARYRDVTRADRSSRRRRAGSAAADRADRDAGRCF